MKLKKKLGTTKNERKVLDFYKYMNNIKKVMIVIKEKLNVILVNEMLLVRFCSDQHVHCLEGRVV